MRRVFRKIRLFSSCNRRLPLTRGASEDSVVSADFLDLKNGMIGAEGASIAVWFYSQIANWKIYNFNPRLLLQRTPDTIVIAVITASELRQRTHHTPKTRASI